MQSPEGLMGNYIKFQEKVKEKIAVVSESHNEER
jgi:hypothetical protein